MKILFHYFIFPGLFFSVVIGLLLCWADRKITARLQWRVGPPWHQNFTDIIKLLYKETIVPVNVRMTFFLAPAVGLFSATLAAAILGRSIISPLESFAGDLIVVLYLLTMPAIAMILGGSSSQNPLASVGASREMKMVLAYELPFLLSVIAVIIKNAGTIQLGSIVNIQANSGANIASLSGACAFISAIFCMQAKLGFVPFDASEADQEIMGGTLIEYSGPLLAFFKLTKAVMFYTMPLLLIVLFLGKDTTPVFMILKYLLLVTIAVLIKNTNPRLRIDQALRFFWGPMTALATISVILAAIRL